MPRSTRDSDEEVEAKAGRRTRAQIGPLPVDSPLRRSNRIKPASKHNESSPESPVSDVSSVSGTQTTRVTRRRAGTMDTGTSSDNQKSLRSRKTSVSSDMSEVAETDHTATPSKRTRRSVAVLTTSDTPKANTRTRRFTRAGSEAKSPPPVSRITRRTRASSMGPENTIDEEMNIKGHSDVTGTPVKTRRRASVAPSEATLTEEKEEKKKILLIELERTLMEVDEDNATELENAASKRVAANKRLSLSESITNRNTTVEEKTDDKVEEENKLVEGQEDSAAENIPSDTSQAVIQNAPISEGKTTVHSDTIMSEKSEIAVTGVSEAETHHSLDDSIEIVSETNTREDLHSLTKGEDSSFNNKENQTANIISDITSEQNTESIVANVFLQTPKPLSASPAHINKSVKEKYKPSGNELSLIKRRQSKDISEVISDTVSVTEIINISNKETESISVNRVEVESVSVSKEEIKSVRDSHTEAKSGSDSRMETESPNDSSKQTELIGDTNKEKESGGDTPMEVEPTSDSNIREVESVSVSVTELESDSFSDHRETKDSTFTMSEETLDKENSQGMLDSKKADEINETEFLDMDKSLSKGNLSQPDTSQVSLDDSGELKKGASTENVSEEDVDKINVETASEAETTMEVQEAETEISENKIGDVSMEDIEESTSVSKAEEEEEEETVNKLQVTDDENESKDEGNKAIEEAKGNETLDSTKTLSCSNLSELATLKTADLVPEANTRPSIVSDDKTTGNPSTLNEEDVSADHPTTAINVPDAAKNEESEMSLIKSSQSSAVAASFAETAEDSSTKEEFSENASVAVSRRKSTDKLRLSESQKEDEVCQDEDKGSQKDVNVEESDTETDAANFFRDISADEWKKAKRNDAETNSVHSMSTERVESESEAECDLILVDREAWLAAESLKAAKEKEPFDYDSDDTVVLKSRADSRKAQGNPLPMLDTVNEESHMDISDDEAPPNINTSRKSLREKNVLSGKDDEVEAEDVESTEKVLNKSARSRIESATPVKSSLRRLSESTSARKSAGGKSSKSMKSDGKEEDMDDSLTSLRLEAASPTEEITSKKRKSFNKLVDTLNTSTPNASKHNTSRSKIVEQSSDDEEEAMKSESADTLSTKKWKSLNKSKIKESDAINSIKSTDEESTVMSSKKKGKNQSLNSSSSKKITKKQLDAELNNESDESEDAEDKIESPSKLKSNMKKKRKSQKNYSTVVNVGSDSDIPAYNADSDSNDSRNESRKIPSFLFAGASSDDSDADGSIDSDIRMEYNLDGEDVAKFSDDDVPGDECRASESESSDPDDNGSDLADFVVNDDEVEDEEEDEDEEESEDEDGLEVEDEDAVETEDEDGLEVEDEGAVEAEDEDGLEVEDEGAVEAEDEDGLEVEDEDAVEAEDGDGLEVEDEDAVEAEDEDEVEVESEEEADMEALEEEQNLEELEEDEKAGKPLFDEESDVDKGKSADEDDAQECPENEGLTIEEVESNAEEEEVLSKSLNMSKSKKLYSDEILSQSLNTSRTKKNRKDEVLNRSLNISKANKGLIEGDLNKSLNTSKTKKERNNENLNESLNASKTKKDNMENLNESSNVIQTEKGPNKEELSKSLNTSKMKKQLDDEDMNGPLDTSKTKKLNTSKMKKRLMDGDVEESLNTSKTKKSCNDEDQTELLNTSKTKKRYDGKEDVNESLNTSKTKKRRKEESQRESLNVSKSKKRHESEDLAESLNTSKTKKQQKEDALERSLNTSKSRKSHKEEDANKSLNTSAAKKGHNEEVPNKSLHSSKTQKGHKNIPINAVAQCTMANKKPENVKRGVKRLSDEIIEKVADIPPKRVKSRSISQERQVQPSRSVPNSGFVESKNTYTAYNFVPLSSSGSTSNFSVVNLQKVKKRTKKIPSVALFRQKMLARNPRYPISAYLMYQEKQRATGNDKYSYRPF